MLNVLRIIRVRTQIHVAAPQGAPINHGGNRRPQPVSWAERNFEVDEQGRPVLSDLEAVETVADILEEMGTWEDNYSYSLVEEAQDKVQSHLSDLYDRFGVAAFRRRRRGQRPGFFSPFWRG